MSNKVILSLGGNLGNVELTFQKAEQLIQQKVGEITLQSSIYSTKAWGEENQPDFLNRVVVVETLLSPQNVLQLLLAIEKKMGRVRENTKKWMERVIDIDILFYDQEIIESEHLIVPHPYLQDRNFVLYPMYEILPDFKHPILGKTIAELKNSCKDGLQVTKVE